MFLKLLSLRIYIHNTRSIKTACWMLGLRCPARINEMYWAGEHPAYLAAAILAVNQQGE